ncbi:FAD-dependent oxidoreductase [Microbacterium rhizosphaerae]|uniref:FAD-dependent oxidoreductase n=1 Tax=Microbacterium rhizosphaerae TaxID=1678237 RepID=A0ABZ0SHA7_9MICO|nr:FAD-dependent oxidoreductase [Microbacterium rhizosphaerae]WPR88589.1 FAD-dependent oxidoreductase [Microbacterium rhizosphaerae]
MISALTSAWSRLFALLGRVSMYRTAFLALALLAVVAFGLSFAGLVAPSPVELLVTAAVLAVVCAAVDAGAQALLRLPWRLESSLITTGILLFVLRPAADPLGIVGLVIAGVAASGSKYLLAYRGRHIFNPAAVGAAVVALIVGISGAYALGGPSWWVGTPALGPVVLLLGLVVLVRAEKLRVAAVFWVIAVVVAVVRTIVQTQQGGFALSIGDVIAQQLWASPFLFLGAFMVSEPLTQPPRRWQALTVAAIVGVLAGWPIDLGAISLGALTLDQEWALLIGNAVAFAFSVRSAVRLVLEGRSSPTPTTQELTFRTKRRLSFLPGQYLELEVPHRKADARGTRREFSIVSAPEDLPSVRIAFREGTGPQSSYKRALAARSVGDTLAVTGVWGDFLLPRNPDSRILLVAAGIGVTPFVSHLRHLRSIGARRDIVLVYVASQASELAYRSEIEDAGIPVVVFTRDEPADLPANWVWAGGARIDATALHEHVPDLRERHVLVSGPAALIADLAPAIDHAKSLTTDAFSGY